MKWLGSRPSRAATWHSAGHAASPPRRRCVKTSRLRSAALARERFCRRTWSLLEQHGISSSHADQLHGYAETERTSAVVASSTWPSLRRTTPYLVRPAPSPAGPRGLSRSTSRGGASAGLWPRGWANAQVQQERLPRPDQVEVGELVAERQQVVRGARHLGVRWRHESTHTRGPIHG